MQSRAHSCTRIPGIAMDDVVSAAVKKPWFAACIHSYVSRVGSTHGVRELIADIVPKVVGFLRGSKRPPLTSEEVAEIRYLCLPPLDHPITKTQTELTNIVWAASKQLNAKPATRLATNQQRFVALRKALATTQLQDIPSWDTDVEAVYSTLRCKLKETDGICSDRVPLAMWTMLLTTWPTQAKLRYTAGPVESALVDTRDIRGAADGRCWYFDKTGGRCTAAASRFWCQEHCAGATVDPTFVTTRGDTKRAKQCPGGCAVYDSGPNAGKRRAGVSRGYHFCNSCRLAQHRRYAQFIAQQPQRKKRRRQSSITDYVTAPKATARRSASQAETSSTTGQAVTSATP